MVSCQKWRSHLGGYVFFFFKTNSIKKAIPVLKKVRLRLIMFVLAELKDTIRIAPEMFHLKLLDAVKDEINRKLANKVKEA